MLVTKRPLSSLGALASAFPGRPHENYSPAQLSRPRGDTLSPGVRAGAPTTFMVTALARACLLGLPVRGRRATPPAGKQLLMSSGSPPGFSALPWPVRHSWNKHSWKWPTLSVPIPNPLALTFPMHRSQRPAPSTCHSTRGFPCPEPTRLCAQGRCQGINGAPPSSPSSSRSRESGEEGPAPMPSAGETARPSPVAHSAALLDHVPSLSPSSSLSPFSTPHWAFLGVGSPAHSRLWEGKTTETVECHCHAVQGPEPEPRVNR